MLRLLTRRKDLTEEDLEERYAEDEETVLRVKRWILRSYAYDRDIVRRLAELLGVEKDQVRSVLTRARSCTALYGLHPEVEQLERLVENLDETAELLLLLDVIGEGELREELREELLELYRGREPVELDRDRLLRAFYSLRERGIV